MTYETRRVQLTILVLAVALVGLGGCSSAPDGAQTDGIAHGAPRAAAAQPPDSPAADADLGPTPAGNPVTITVSLRLPGQADLTSYLRAMADPSSPDYRRYLSPTEFGARFGLPLAEIDRVAGWLSGSGLAVTRLPQRTSLAASGSAGQVEQLLGIQLVDHQTADGQLYHAPIGTPQIPAGLAGDVATVIGLDTEPALRSGNDGGVFGADVPGGAMQPIDAARAYGIDALWNAGLHGEGQTVGLVALDTFTQSDVDMFDQRNNINGPPIEVVKLPDALTTPGTETGEIALDLQVLRGLAPQAQIIAYELSTDFGSMTPVISRIVADGRVRIVSISFGLCEKYYPPDVRAADEQELAAAFAAGISIFVASGDYGAYGCRNVQLRSGAANRDLSASANWPASSPSVIAVGGTYLSVREDGNYLTEKGWEDPLSAGAAGGGLSVFYDRPDWQAGVGVDNADSNGKRQVPDVAGPADPASGFDIQYTEAGGDFVDARVGGTSAATPFFAATMVLTEQLAQREGVDFNAPLGPVLYQVAVAQGADAVFHDVIGGGNLMQQAGPGWDYATGLGTPRAPQLARAIVDFLAR